MTARPVIATRTARSTATRTAVTITHPEKVLFPDDGITKGEVAAYYASVATIMLPHVRGRPVTLERFPSGIDAKGFLQKNVVKGFPAWLERAELPKKDGTVFYPLAGDARSLQWMANQNTVTLHVWPSRMPHPWEPDVCVFDLDPAVDDPERLRAAALGLRDLLAERKMRARGQDVGVEGLSCRGAAETRPGRRRVPLRAWRRRRADRAAARSRDAGVQQSRPRRPHPHRHRPQPAGATMAAAYTLRARPGAPVSAPCTWEEIEQRPGRPALVHAADDGGAARRRRRPVAGSRPPRPAPARSAWRRGRR